MLTGAAKQRLSTAIRAAFDDPDERGRHSEEYAYYPTQWASPYIDRRRKVGWDDATTSPLKSVRGIGYRLDPPA